MKKQNWNYEDISRNAWMWEVDPVGTGKRLREIRLANKFSQDDVVEFFYLAGAEITKQAISNWENGRTVPSYNHMIVLGDGLYGVSIDWLYVRYGKNQERAESDDQPAPPIYVRHFYFIFIFFV